jgi:RNA polymerase sigma-70 factor (ECF subfamily)
MGANSFDMSPTSPSLLIRLRDTGDQRAWDEFHTRYAPMIRGWCRHWFPRETDDMVQEVFIRLTKCLKAFDYKPGTGRFRGYLKTVTHRLMQDLKERAVRQPPIDGDAAPDEVPVREDLWDRLAAMFDLELLEQAKAEVRARVTDRTWSAYVAVAEQGRDPAEVARELGMRVGAVYQARYSVITELKREIENLQGLS